jgi:hypothetical protein
MTLIIFYRTCLQIQPVKRIASIFFFLFFSAPLIAQITDQSNSCRIQVSLLTCTPGTELYSTFGHSALRIVDSTKGTDIIYNYGTFDFDDPKFYSKFVRGKLLYFVSVEQFQGFRASYEYEKRGITEQILYLSCDKKAKLIAALEENAKEENKYYKYDFVRDNCTTRLRDIIEKFSDTPYVTRPLVIGTTTFRKLIHSYLDKSGQYWSKLGIDILLGAPVDHKLSTKEIMFLPDYLLRGFDSTMVAGYMTDSTMVPGYMTYIGYQTSLVIGKKVILDSSLSPEMPSALSPLIIFSILFLLITALSFSRSRKIQIALNIFDKIFFFTCGILGMLILFMWFGTDHYTCHNNFNLLWALPTHLFVVAISFQKNRVKKYFRIIFWLTTALLLCWLFLPQQMNNALFPVVGMIFVRSFFISKKP